MGDRGNVCASNRLYYSSTQVPSTRYTCVCTDHAAPTDRSEKLRACVCARGKSGVGAQAQVAEASLSGVDARGVRAGWRVYCDASAGVVGCAGCCQVRGCAPKRRATACGRGSPQLPEPCFTTQTPYSVRCGPSVWNATPLHAPCHMRLAPQSRPAHRQRAAGFHLEARRRAGERWAPARGGWRGCP